MLQKLWLDTETYCEKPIKWGTYQYAEACEVMIATYAFDEGPVYEWDVASGEPMPSELIEGIDTAEELWAQNSPFDRNVLRFNFPEFDWSRERWRDTMIQAYEHSLPGALGKLAEALKLPTDQLKDKRGKALIQLFCKPRPKTSKIRRATRETHPEEWAELLEYAKQDIVTMRAAHHKMPKWNYPNNLNELAYWHLDQKINDRGFKVDMELVEAAIETVRIEKLDLKKQTVEATDGALSSTTKSVKLLEHILEYHGVSLPDLQKATIQRRLDDPDLPDGVRELLAIRLQDASASTSKYVALQRATSSDGRCKGTIQFCGAKRTGRGAGRTFQPQNLPSRGILEGDELDIGIEFIKLLCAGKVFPELMKLLSSAVRGCLISADRRKLVVADLSNIEGRLAAWFAGEEWKLGAFREFDAGEGHDLYNLAYSKAFRIDVDDVTKPQRAIGKVMELFLGYAGGVGAFVTGAAGYGFDIEELAEDNYDTLPTEQLQQAEDFYDWLVKRKASTFGLSRQGFVTCDVFKRLWRESNSAIAAYWKILENCAKKAIKKRGQWFDAGPHIKMRCDGGWLRVRLPSGRFLCYPSPRLEGSDESITYMGDNPYTRQWTRLKTYGGKLLENICQATGREILYAGMLEAEAHGYETLISVHDELVTETLDKKELTVDKLSAIMSRDLSWTKGLPLAAAGFESYRYRK